MQRELKRLLQRGSCLSCQSQGILPILLMEQRGVPPGQEGHTIAYEHTMVVLCSKCGSGHVEKHDHDCFDFEEVWDQAEWYTLDAADMATLRGLIAGCPQPFSAECDCPVHAGLRSGCRELPAKGWQWALEADAHVHQVSLEIKDGVPRPRLS